MQAQLETAKILRIDDYRPEFALGSPEAERQARAVCREKLFVQVILCEREPALVGRTWSCRTTRVSPDHVEFACDRPLPVGALVDLWVDVAAQPGKFFLSGRVRWTRPGEEGRTFVGIELQDGAATDFDAWRDLHG